MLQVWPFTLCGTFHIQHRVAIYRLFQNIVLHRNANHEEIRPGTNPMFVCRGTAACGKQSQELATNATISRLNFVRTRRDLATVASTIIPPEPTAQISRISCPVF